MPYRIDTRRKTVSINGRVDMAVIMEKVRANGGPKGWQIRSYTTKSEVQEILRGMGFGEAQEEPTLRTPIGFKIAAPSEPTIVTGLSFHPPDVVD